MELPPLVLALLTTLLLALGASLVVGPRVESPLDFDLNEPAPESATGEWAAPKPEPEPERASKRRRTADSWARGSCGAWAARAWRTTKAKLPDYFNFDAFRARLQRKYPPRELLYRKWRFLQQCVEVFKARVQYRLGKVGHLEEVNHLSDRSPNELRRMFMSGPPPEFRPKHQTEQQYAEAMRRDRQSRELFDAELESESSAIEDHEDHDDEWQSVIGESLVEQQLEQMLAGAACEPATSAAIRNELSGAFIESHSSEAAPNDDSDNDESAALPWPGQASSANFVASTQPNAGRELYAPPVELIGLGRAARAFDWSRHACFHRVYDQGQSCGNCYAMAATTLAEFYKCTEVRGAHYPRQFSKQYVMDCAQKYSASVLGCMGGSIVDTLSFIAQAGVFSIGNWKSRRLLELRRAKAAGKALLGQAANCPLDQFELPFESWGDVKVTLNPRPVHANDWMRSLRDGPLVVAVRMPAKGVASYAGGTHSGESCLESDYWHSMVLVGYGVDERGVKYWRFRNSYGPNWGDRGHFQLAMSVAGECLVGGVRVFREPLERANE